MKIKLMLIQAIFLMTMVNLMGQQNEGEPIFEEVPDTPTPKAIKSLDGIGEYVIDRKGTNFTIIEQDDQFGVLDSMDQVIIDPFVNGKIEREQIGYKIKHNKRYGFYDIYGNELLKPIYKSLYISNDYIITKESNSGLYKLGKGHLLDTVFCFVGPFGGSNKNLFKISEDCNSYAIVDIDTLNSNLEYEYQTLSYLSVVRKFLVKKEDKFGMIDHNASKVIPMLYEKLFPFKNYVIAIRDGRYGIIDYENNEIVPFSYTQILQGASDDFIVAKNGKFGTINLAEETIIPLKFSGLRGSLYLNTGYIFEENYKNGLVSFDGKMIVEPKYSQIKGINKRLEDWTSVVIGYILRDMDGKLGFANTEGKEVSACIFDSIKQNKGQDPFPLKVTMGEYAFDIDKLGNCVGDCPPKEVYRSQKK